MGSRAHLPSMTISVPQAQIISWIDYAGYRTKRALALSGDLRASRSEECEMLIFATQNWPLSRCTGVPGIFARDLGTKSSERPTARPIFLASQISLGAPDRLAERHFKRDALPALALTAQLWPQRDGCPLDGAVILAHAGLDRALRQANAACSPSSRRIRLNVSRSGPPEDSMKMSISNACNRVWRSPMIS